ncbi:MAG TPA: hypothetical protein VL404_04500 [Candidatus Eisenbacteria bacterium]|nr:hypothetical protein [Candidatus Eisenbacteria bacterium]
MKLLHVLGRGLELLALLVLPSAIWVAQFRHDEAGAILIFTGSIVVFFAGFLLIQLASRGR